MCCIRSVTLYNFLLTFGFYSRIFRRHTSHFAPSVRIILNFIKNTAKNHIEITYKSIQVFHCDSTETPTIRRCRKRESSIRSRTHVRITPTLSRMLNTLAGTCVLARDSAFACYRKWPTR